MDRNLSDNLVENSNPENEAAVLFDNETEKALLCLCMRSKEALNEVVGKTIIADDFADTRHYHIYKAIMDLYLNGGNIDRFTVYEKAESMGKLQAAGGTEYIFSVANYVAVLSNLDSYIDIVKEKSNLRRVVNTLNDLQKKANTKGVSANDIVAIGVNRLSELRTGEKEEGFEPLGAILKKNINKIAKLAGGGEDDAFKSYFRKLDAMTGGFRGGTLNILAARPGMGKTALVINIATNIATNAHRPVCIFSLEMSKEEIGNRILASRSQYSAKQLQRAGKGFKPEDVKSIVDAFKGLSDLPIYIDDNSMVDPAAMLSKCKELKMKGQLGLVIVDYLQLMNLPDAGANSSRQNEIAAISRSLKILAKELDVPVIALSQLSRGSEKREDHTPMLSDLRDSGAIEQDADCVLFISRSAYYKKGEAAPEIEDADIIVAKNRHGETGPVRVKWWGAKTLFFEEDRKYDPQDPATTGMQSSSSYTRTQTTGSAASDYSFEETPSTPAPDVPSDIPEDIPFDADNLGEPIPPPENSENDAFFGGVTNSDFPDGFM